MKRIRASGIIGAVVLALAPGRLAAEPPPPDFTVNVETVLKHDDHKFLWYHPRPAPIPGRGRDGRPAVVMTLQKHLQADDHYSGLYVLRTDDLGAHWAGPVARPELDWVKESDRVDVAVADVTPAWHARTGKVLAVGAQVRYSKAGVQLEDRPRSNQTAYAVFDPSAGTWSAWRRFEMPPGPRFNFARCACAQFVVRPDGTVLLPFYFGRNQDEPWSVTVVEASFDGRELKYIRHGTEMSLKVQRGLVEPSLVWFGGRYYLTIRNDERGYVTTSADGLRYAPIRPWTFDDASDLGSYNTQQHWLAHGDGLFLVYTRRGARNDHIVRHRAPLFIARVDPGRLQVIRKTERVLIPERGAELGNFGAAAIDAHESWVTVAEGIWSEDARRRGAKGAVFVARVRWSRPNALAPTAE